MSEISIHFDYNFSTRWARSARFSLAVGCRWLPGSIARIAAAALVAISGCGPKSDRFEISGIVTLDGQPLDGAAIRLTSLGVDKSSAGAVIQGGEFRIPQDKGLRAGEYQVEINAPDDKGPPVMSPGPGGGIPTASERVPSDYNVNSEQTINVTADGDNHFVFEIVSGPS